MNRINRILQHEAYCQALLDIASLEEGLIFCKHNIEHFLDVARLGYLFNLLDGLTIPKEEIYAAALLHDIGRHVQYLKKIPHQESSAQIAEGILQDCSFSKCERMRILEAIRAHCDANTVSRKDLAGILYQADKKSRACFACETSDRCNWSEETKNMRLEF